MPNCTVTVCCTEIILWFCVSAFCCLSEEITNYSCHTCEFVRFIKHDSAFAMVQQQQNIIASVYLVVEVCFSLQPLSNSNFRKLNNFLPIMSRISENDFKVFFCFVSAVSESFFY